MKVTVSEYKHEWATTFLNEKAILEKVLSLFSPAIEHIGSTSIPGLAAKPIVDIMVGIGKDTNLDEAITPMVNTGYSYIEKYTPDWPERRYFEKYSDASKHIDTIHVHIFVKNTPDWIRHLAFRNYLLSHPEKRDEYGKLKIELSRKEFNSKQEYQDAKNDFIKLTEQAALEWYL